MFLSKKELSKRMFKPLIDTYYFNKKENFFKKNKKELALSFDYDLCEISKSYGKELLNSCFEKEVFISSMNEFHKTKVLYGIKSTGDNFGLFYNREIAPFYVYLINSYDTFTIRFIAYSIDDSSYGFFLSLNSKEEYDRVLEDIKEWLISFSELPPIPEFEKYWNSKYKNINYDYN